MKIGVLTYFWSENPGTFLQAYSIQQAYRGLFPDADVEVINYQSFRSFWLPNRSCITLAQWRRDVLRYLKYRHSRQVFLNLTRKHLVTKHAESAWRFMRSLNYDLISVGSDTLLELWRSDPHSVTPYWLDPSMPCKKVMCAASARATQYTELSQHQREFLKRSVAGFDLLGVRDIATYELICSLGGAQDKLQLVPDPTFAYVIDNSHAKRYLQNRGISFDKPTIALHLTRQVTWASELAEMFRDRGWQVLSMRPANYADYVVNDTSPFEWAGIFSFCDLAITQSFHDTVFSMKSKIPVVCLVGQEYVTTSGDSKYHTLMRAFGLSETNVISDWTQSNAIRVLEAGLEAFAKHQPMLIESKVATLEERLLEYMRQIRTLLP